MCVCTRLGGVREAFGRKPSRVQNGLIPPPPPYIVALLNVPIPKVLKRMVHIGHDWSEVPGKANEQCAEQRPGGRACLGPGGKADPELCKGGGARLLLCYLISHHPLLASMVSGGGRLLSLISSAA